MSGRYIFDNVNDDDEFNRLQSIESVNDKDTIARLKKAGVKPGNGCLEVGSGAGSIAQWMSDTVGKHGWVTVIDKNLNHTRHGFKANYANYELRETNILDGVEEGVYDVAHARFVIKHISDPAKGMAVMVNSLKPRGKIVIEDVSYEHAKTANPDSEEGVLFTKVMESMKAYYSKIGLDYAFGAKLPKMMLAAGARNISVDKFTVHVTGGSEVGRLMGKTFESLKPELVKSGGANPMDVDQVVNLFDDPNFEARLYELVGCSGTAGT